MKTSPREIKKIGVIISTYNQPEWLKKVLWGYAHQTRLADEIIIADDGSSGLTAKMVEEIKTSFDLPIKHIWHADCGFQKNKIINSAILSAKSDYLIFTDQDCIPRADFIETHSRMAEKGYYLSGGYFKLPTALSHQIKLEDIASQNAFQLKWLLRQGVRWHFKCTKLFKSKSFACLMNLITPAKSSWNGCNSSGWKIDLMRLNGFNENLRYGGEDRELGERLNNLKIYGKQIRYSAICIHLDHERPYKEEETIKANKQFRKTIRHSGQYLTENGLEQGIEKSHLLSKKILCLTTAKTRTENAQLIDEISHYFTNKNDELICFCVKRLPLVQYLLALYILKRENADTAIVFDNDTSLARWVQKQSALKFLTEKRVLTLREGQSVEKLFDEIHKSIKPCE